MKWASLIFLLALNLEKAYSFDDKAFTDLDKKHKYMASEGFTTNELDEANDVVKTALAAEKLNPTKFYEESFGVDCSLCPSHLKLTSSINKVLDKMKKNSDVASNEEVPININRLKFLFYTVKTRQEDGSIKCERFRDMTPDLKPTRFEGDMKLMAEDVLKFDGISNVQIMDPKKEEVVYYYRGEGTQKNIIVQAVMDKEGGKFRYYYYRPTEKEKNPYNLPSLGEEEEGLVTHKKSKPKAIEAPVGLLPASKDKMNFSFDPVVERRQRMIPKNIHLAQGELSQEVTDGVRVNANTNLSVAKGNVATLNLANDKGEKYVELYVRTNMSGSTSHKVTIPYEVRLNKEEAADSYALRGSVEDNSDARVATLSLVDKYKSYVTTEIRRDKETDKTSMSVGKTFDMGKAEIASVSVGRDGDHAKYVAFQHKKSIRDNVTMVMDVRVDDNKKATFMYQLRARF